MIPPRGCEPRCGACPDRDRTASESTNGKLAWLMRALARWAPALEPVRSVPEPGRWGYRDRSVLAVQWSGARFEAGLWRGRGRDAEFISIPECPVHSPSLRRRVQQALDALPRDAAFPVSHLAVSGSLTTLVLKAKPSEVAWRWKESGLREVGAEGGWIHWNPSAGNRVFTARIWEHAWGARTARFAVPGWPGAWEHGPQSFLQLIPLLYGDALRTARDFLDPREGSSVLDLCSGVGVSMGGWLERGARTIGVELSGEAIACLERNLSGRGDAIAFRGKASERIPQYDAAWNETPRSRRLAYVNPPRLGLEPQVLEHLVTRGQPRRIAYLSCSAGTLARDLDRLESGGYDVKRIVPFDFFPQTRHVETLALLEWRQLTG